VIEAEGRLNGLDTLRRQKLVNAEAGADGGSGKRHGGRGTDAVVYVPVGTVVWKDDEQVADVDKDGACVPVAWGGSGGRGNARLATPERQTPRISERGLGGEEATVRLEWRPLVDVVLVGPPSVGKSALLAVLTGAQADVQPYGFSTREVQFGVVEVKFERWTIADTPSLASGASQGEGLGCESLRYLVRAGVVAVVVDATHEVKEQVSTVRQELIECSPGLAAKPWVVVVNKTDLVDATALRSAMKRLAAQGIETYVISAAAGTGLEELLRGLSGRVQEAWRAAVQLAAAAPEPELRPRPERSAIEVVRIDRGFEVKGGGPARVVARIGVETEEARGEVRRRLRRMGVAAALRKAGAQPGDRIRVAGVVLEWPL